MGRKPSTLKPYIPTADSSLRAGDQLLEDAHGTLLNKVSADLRAEMARSWLTFSSLAGALQVSVEYVYHLMSGRQNCTLRTLVEVSAVLGRRPEVRLRPLSKYDANRMRAALRRRPRVPHGRRSRPRMGASTHTATPHPGSGRVTRGGPRARLPPQ